MGKEAMARPEKAQVCPLSWAPHSPTLTVEGLTEHHSSTVSLFTPLLGDLIIPAQYVQACHRYLSLSVLS